MTTALDCDVTVIGAGPTGLMAALLLKRAGIGVRILEKRLEATRESRAFAVQSRSIELFQRVGLAGDLLKQGVICHSVNIHVRGTFRGGIDARKAQATDTRYPFIHMVPQSIIEDAMIAELAKLGCTVERGVEITGVTQDATGVTCTGTSASGAPVQLRSAYLIGADGSRSIARSQAGISWEGELLPQRFLLADCKVDWPFDHSHFRVFLNRNLIGLFLPLHGSGLSRVMATDVSGNFGAEDASVPAPLDLAEMEAGMRAACQVPITLSDPVWVTRYRAHHRNVDRYREKRIFVAGDAAHIHSPAGGQGMNTGLQDVENLVWKLAMVLRGAPEPLLDSYNGERLPVGEMVVRTTGKLFAAAAGLSGIKASLRDFLAVPALKIISNAPPIQKKAFSRISQRNIVYGPGAVCAPDPAGWSSGPACGARAPNGPVTAGTDLHSLLTDTGFSLLLFTRAGDTETVVQQAEAAIAPLRHLMPGSASHILSGASSELFARYGVAESGAGGLYLVRPDGYIAWRSQGLDFAGARKFAASFSA